MGNDEKDTHSNICEVLSAKFRRGYHIHVSAFLEASGRCGDPKRRELQRIVEAFGFGSDDLRVECIVVEMK